MSNGQKTQPVLIKKYSNRRLYDMELKRYITLEELRDRIRDGAEVQVVDSKTGEDLTQVVLIQLILETEKTPFNGLLTSELLHQLIQYREQSLVEFFQNYLPGIMRSYIAWQQEAQNQFMNWAKLGWSANRYSRDFFMPNWNMWGWSGGPGGPPPGGNGHNGQPHDPDEAEARQAEIEQLRQKVEDLERRLKKSSKSS